MLAAGMYAGLVAGIILVLVAHIAPRFGAGNFIQDTDKPVVFGRELTRREAHLLGILIHLILSILFGLGFSIAVDQGWASGFHLLPMLGYCVLLVLFFGLIIMPIEGHGIFGIKHDKWFVVDVLLTNFFWGLLYLLFIPLWVVV